MYMFDKQMVYMCINIIYNYISVYTCICINVHSPGFIAI